MTNNFSPKKLGFKYFFDGISLCLHKGNKRFIFIPIIINIIIYIIGAYFIMGSIWDFFNELCNNSFPSYLSWLSWIIVPLVDLIIMVIMIYLFTTIALVIGSPFYTMLAEKAQSIVTNEEIPDSTILETLKDIPHTIGLELLKLVYRIPLIILSFILIFIPIIGQIAIVIISAWCYGMDFTSYAFENNKVSFKKTREYLLKNKTLILTYGLVSWIVLLIPLLNLFMIPVAICGATALWVENIRPQLLIDEIKNDSVTPNSNSDTSWANDLNKDASPKNKKM